MNAPSPAIPMCFALLVALAPETAGCGRTGSVALIFATDTEGQYRGFRCVDLDAGLPMWSRGWDPQDQTVRFSLVVDTVALGGLPDCRPSQLFDWCAEHECVPLVEQRFCVAVEVPISQGADFDVSLDSALQSLGGTLVSGDGPDEPVLVRAVATAESCAEIADSPEFACGSLIGCVYSCPALLDELDNDLVLDLDVGGTHCRPDVEQCAAPLFGDTASCE